MFWATLYDLSHSDTVLFLILPTFAVHSHTLSHMDALFDIRHRVVGSFFLPYLRVGTTTISMHMYV